MQRMFASVASNNNLKLRNITQSNTTLMEHRSWCHDHGKKKTMRIWDVTYFAHNQSKRNIVVCRDVPAAVNIGVLALLRACQRHAWFKEHGHDDVDVKDFKPSLSLWTPGSCCTDDSGKVVCGRPKKDGSNVINMAEVKSLRELCAQVGWKKTPFRYFPGMKKKYAKKKFGGDRST